MYFKIPNFKFQTLRVSNGTTLNSRKKGFTLLEIMIALALIGITLMTVLHTVNYHTGISNENITATQITELAKEKLFDLQESPVSSTGNIEGTSFTYENIVSETDYPGIIELKTIVKGSGKEIMLNQLVRHEN